MHQTTIQSNMLDNCFPSGTPITLADGSTKPIEQITTADTVLSFDAGGNLTTGHVTQLLPSIITEWLILSNGTTVTPDHRYLRPDGSFMEIADIIALDGRITSAANVAPSAILNIVSPPREIGNDVKLPRMRKPSWGQ